MINYLWYILLIVTVLTILKNWKDYKTPKDLIEHNKILKKLKKLKTRLDLKSQIEYTKISEKINKNYALNWFALILSLVLFYGILIIFLKMNLFKALLFIILLTMFYFGFNIEKFNFKNYTCLMLNNISYFLLLYLIFNIEFDNKFIKIILLILIILYSIILNKIIKKLFRWKK
jgi:DNA modification methylase